MQRTLAAQRVGYGTSGVTLSGSALDVLVDNANEYQRDIERMLRGGQYQSTALREQASINRSPAKAVYSSGMFKTFGSLITSGFEIASKFLVGLRQLLGILALVRRNDRNFGLKPEILRLKIRR